MMKLLTILQTSLKAKIIASVVGVTVIAGGSVGGYTVYKSNQEVIPNQEVSLVSPESEKDNKVTDVETEEVEEESNLPEVDSNESTESESAVEENEKKDSSAETSANEVSKPDTTSEPAPSPTPIQAPTTTPTPAPVVKAPEPTPTPTPTPAQDPMFKPYPTGTVLWDYKKIGPLDLKFRVNQFGIEGTVDLAAVKQYAGDQIYMTVYFNGSISENKMRIGNIIGSGEPTLVAFGTFSYVENGSRWTKPGTYRVHIWAEQGEYSLVKTSDRPKIVEIADATFSVNQQGFAD